MRLSKISVLMIFSALVSSSLYAQEKECVATNNAFRGTKNTVENLIRANGALARCAAEVKGLPEKAATLLPAVTRECLALSAYQAKKPTSDNWAACTKDLQEFKVLLSGPAPTAIKAPAAASAKNAFSGYEEKLAAAKTPKQKELAAQIMKFKDEYNQKCPTSVAASCVPTKTKLAPLMAQFNAAANAGTAAPAKGGAKVLSMPTKHK